MMSRADGEALSELHRRYGKEVLDYLVGMTRDPDLAADVRQEVFLRAWRYADSYRHRGSVRGWLFVIARNERVDALQRRTRDRALSVAEPTDERREDPPDQSPDPYRIVAGQERMERLQEALWDLSEPTRELLLLARVEGMTYRELGDLMGVSPGALRVRVSRALRALRDSMERMDGEGGHDVEV